MGNQLTGVAPSQILPVEHYLADNTEYEYESSLGSTRFFKAARVKCKEGLAVVKVFVIHDPSLPLETHKKRLDDLAVRLKTTPNCLPFQKSVQLDRSALLFRQYIKYSLYDRMSTRPFLSTIEKRWIAFQLLCALNQCHKVKVCHGDIKSENVMVTSWNWVILTDFASFKPTYLPEDNPSEFLYFFDTSRRRTCYVAPERFVHSSSLASEGDLGFNVVRTGDLTPAMDIFSAGCVITELFTDGTPPFDLSLLLNYRIGEYSPWKILEKIEDSNIRELVRHMLQKDPSHRLTAEEYLVKQRGKAFPDVFYTCLKMYQQQFAVSPIIPPDDRILCIRQDFDHLMKTLQVREDKLEDNCVLVLLISLVTSACRDLHFSSNRLAALELLYKLSGYVTVDVILNRILPYINLILELQVRLNIKYLPYRTLYNCLHFSFSCSESNVFPEYIFPALANLVHDDATIVRTTYAKNIAQLAETALRFVEIFGQQKTATNSSKLNYCFCDAVESTYDMELQSLQETIQQKVVTILSDPENSVKQTLLENGITRLCVFFGKQKGNDVLLSHMITFLNDKHDWQLRAAFFRAIVGVAAYVGWQSVVILKPLLQQGLSDTEEFVIHKTLGALKTMVELGLMQKQVILEFVNDVVPLLAHPDVWIRQGSVGFVSAVASKMDVADLHVKIIPKVKPFLKRAVLQLHNELVMLDAVDEPISRTVYDYILRSPHLEHLFDVLQSRASVRLITRQGHKPMYSETDENIMQIFRKLNSLGMTEAQESKLLAMKDFLLKLHKARAGSADTNDDENSDQLKPGVINIRSSHINITRRHAELYKSKEASSDTSSTARQPKKRVQRLESGGTAMNPEWKKMFGSDDTDRSSADSVRSRASAERQTEGLEGKRLSLMPPMMQPPPVSVGGQSPHLHQLPMEPPSLIQEKPQKTVVTRYANCKLDLRTLVHHLRDQYEAEVTSRDLMEGITWDQRPPPDNWRPRGTLVAHLQEHKGMVNRLCVCNDHQFFASCSNDGTVRLWDVASLEGKTAANRPKFIFSKQGGHIKCGTFCEGSASIASASDNGSLHVYRLEISTVTPAHALNIDKEKYGIVMDMSHFDTGAQSLLVQATVNNYVVGWDLRMGKPAWELHNNVRTGLITTMAVHPTQSWLALGTSSGAHVCWDLRFQLQINNIQHPTGARVRRIVMHPKKQSWLVSAVQWNNEVSMWDVESRQRQEALWASHHPPLTERESSGQAVHGLYVASTDTHVFALTGGSDRCIRYWDLKCPSKSFIMSHGPLDQPTNHVAYRSQLIEGTEVIQEVKTEHPVSREEGPQCGPDAPATGHLDTISDIALCQASQWFVVSAAHNGHIKVWK
ncbi:hypothetical protein C0Q70_03878 [Pomacea canaliculata]|uniref:non-specific serine/threonine protein kinase n=1 Tax=Pomacea canaliculata TaxID=400727 RepID=A0A2T7PTZ8_POMCA|nr:hypothetical protein C0Q70_03878 [Pomacea canaliculata]